MRFEGKNAVVTGYYAQKDAAGVCNIKKVLPEEELLADCASLSKYLAAAFLPTMG